ncbi:MAG: tetratricopeptide repeat protein, partial [Pyrinomonadaceae bacterium]
GARQLEKKLSSGPSCSNRGRRILSRYKFYFRGILALENNQTDEALAEMKEAVRHLPPTYDMDPLEDCLAQALLRVNRFDEAVTEFERVLRLNPNYPLGRFYLALALERRGQNEKAHENYKLFLELWKDADADIPEVIAARKSLSAP